MPSPRPALGPPTPRSGRSPRYCHQTDTEARRMTDAHQHAANALGVTPQGPPAWGWRGQPPGRRAAHPKHGACRLHLLFALAEKAGDKLREGTGTQAFPLLCASPARSPSHHRGNPHHHRGRPHRPGRRTPGVDQPRRAPVTVRCKRHRRPQDRHDQAAVHPGRLLPSAAGRRPPTLPARDGCHRCAGPSVGTPPRSPPRRHTGLLHETDRTTEAFGVRSAGRWSALWR